MKKKDGKGKELKKRSPGKKGWKVGGTGCLGSHRWLWARGLAPAWLQQGQTASWDTSTDLVCCRAARPVSSPLTAS